jgi:hypothetical protein
MNWILITDAFLHSQPFYGLGDNYPGFFNALISFSHRILVWPNPTELERSGRKYIAIDLLDRVAKLMGTQRPTSQLILRDGTKPPKGRYVLKREFSANAGHVHIVDGISTKTWKELDGQNTSRFVWIQQDYAPLLEQWGEYRIFMVGGQVWECVMTYRNKDGLWEWRKARFGYTLERLEYGYFLAFYCIIDNVVVNREMLREDPHVPCSAIGLPIGVTQSQIAAAQEELYSFALETLAHIIRSEQLANGCEPSLALYCRMDVGIHVRSDGKLCYFVNELCRGPLATCLWTATDVDLAHIASNLGAEFAPILYRWMNLRIAPRM